MKKQVTYQPQNTIIVFDLNGVVLRLSPWQVMRIALGSPYRWRMLRLAFNPAFDWYILSGLYRKRVVEHMINEMVTRFELFAALRTTALEIVNAQYPRRGMLEIIKHVHQRGYQLAVLTNIGQESIGILKNMQPELFAQFSHIIHASATDGYTAKPDPRAFYKLQEQIGNNKYVILIDDNNKNIKQAEQLGMHGIKFRGSHNLKMQLRHLGIR